MSKKTILIDFDHTIFRYSQGWKGETVIDGLPVDGTKDALKELRKTYTVIVFSTRAKTEAGISAIREWLEKWEIEVDAVTHEKIPASVIIDDRAIQFRGDWRQTLRDTKNFSVWERWHKQKDNLMIYVLVGNIGTGKSTRAKELHDENTIIVNYDSIFPMLSSGNYSYEKKKVPIYRAIEETAVVTALRNGLNVVVDRTNLTRQIRARYIEMGKRYDADIVCIDFGSGSDESLSRRQQADDDRGKSPEKWAKVHVQMQRQYEKPSLEEGFSKIIQK